MPIIHVSKRPFPVKDFIVAVTAMIAMVVASNILVQYPVAVSGLDQVLTWGAFTYPFVFLITDLSNRRVGPAFTRKVAYIGFAVAVVMSVVLATPRIAIASGTAFLCSQMLDIVIFSRMNQRVWWLPPFVSTLVSSAVDTALFFSLAFYCGIVPLIGMDIDSLFASLGVVGVGCVGLPWITLAMGDFMVKIVMNLLSLAPYRYLLVRLVPGALTVARKPRAYYEK